jgi:hypothetical protein
MHGTALRQSCADIVRYVEEGGASSRQSEFCNKDAKVEIEAAKAKGIVIHDLRN